MYQDGLIKGRIAETIVSEMLREAGYFVYRFGYEGILQNLAQKNLPKMKSEDFGAKKVRAMPDFIVMNKEGEVYFVEVKFRSSDRLEDETKSLIFETAKNWPEARMLFVKPKKPHFLISRAKDFTKTGKFYLLEEEKFLKVDKSIIEKYEKLVEKYYLKI